jgi:uncharacterized protein YdaL
MKYKFINSLIFLLLIFTIFQTSLFSQNIVKFGVFGNGAGVISGSNYVVKGTINQPAIGISENTNYAHFAGFWRGAYHITSVEDILFDLPTSYELYQNYPNPFNPSTVIKYDLPVPSKVRINVYNLLGQKITTLQDNFKPAGSHKITFNASNISSGMYFYIIESEGFKKVKRMVLAK